MKIFTIAAAALAGLLSSACFAIPAAFSSEKEGVLGALYNADDQLHCIGVVDTDRMAGVSVAVPKGNGSVPAIGRVDAQWNVPHLCAPPPSTSGELSSLASWIGIRGQGCPTKQALVQMGVMSTVRDGNKQPKGDGIDRSCSYSGLRSFKKTVPPQPALSSGGIPERSSI